MDNSIRRLIPVYVLVFLRGFSLSLTVNGPVMPLYVRSLGVSVSKWSFLATSLAVGLISFEAFWGSMSDRVDRIRILVLSMILMSCVLPLYTFKSLLPYFFIFQFLIGAFFVMVGPTSRALIADLSPDDRLGFNMSLWSTCVAIGGILGPVFGGWITLNYGYPTAFYTSTVILLVAAIITFTNGKDNPSKPRGGGPRVLLTSSKEIIADPRIRITFLMALSIYVGVSAIRSFLPIYASELFGMDEISIGFMLTLGTAMQLFGTPIVGMLSDRISVKKMLSILLGSSGILLLTYLYASTPLHLIIITILVIFTFSSQSVSLIMLSKLADRDKLGMTMGLYGSFEDLGLIVGPIIFGGIWEGLGPKYLFPVSAMALLFAIISLSQVKIEN